MEADGGEEVPDESTTTLSSTQTDYENFLNSQIDSLIRKEREGKSGQLEKADELAVAIEFCKQHLIDKPESASHQQRRRVVMSRLVELKLELEQLKVVNLRTSRKELQKYRNAAR